MKKAVLLIVLTAITFSCGVPKTVIQSKKVIKGIWELNTISYDQAGTYNMTLFNDASKECFEGSTWRFIPNNNTGLYTINGSSCATGERYFIFEIQEENAENGLYDFMLKPTDAKGKSETNTGYRVQLTQLSDTNMQWKQTLTLEGKPFSFNMNFTKTQ